MKILLTRKQTQKGDFVSQIKAADAYTIAHEPIASIDLMERAARAFVNDISQRFPVGSKKVVVLCGLGDNGGDGLAIARMLDKVGYEVEVFVIDYAQKSSDNFRINEHRLQNLVPVKYVTDEKGIPAFKQDFLVIDAILGAGLSRPINGLIQATVEELNKSKAEIIAVDIPTGLFADSPNKKEDTIVKATYTVSFQLPKLAFVLPQNAEYVGEWKVVNIGLNEEFINQTETDFVYTDSPTAQKLIKPRNRFAHKGNFGHALMMAGSYGMIGAAVMATRACLRSGVGKITIAAPKCGYAVLQTAIPEAMCLPTEDETYLKTLPDLTLYQAIGIGCGIGNKPETIRLVEQLLKHTKAPLVIDADALNIIASNEKLLNLIPENSVLTPHPKEFERLIGKKWDNDYEKLQILSVFAIKYKCVVCLKGAFTAVALPDGTIHFNSTGNAGMAKGGSGDVLTGIILALLAQGYPASEAAILGVYEHGLAGDRTAQTRGMVSMIATDIIENIRF
ncbi:NAD(P)H-hydrate dehydratase [Emticicia sp. 17c]|uniref:NAD(P)H-hydrate dehydratase n=1 Tax=Emticicia sp. 17c TaxID=3127704 RepID=UPI00301D20BE